MERACGLRFGLEFEDGFGRRDFARDKVEDFEFVERPTIEDENLNVTKRN